MLATAEPVAREIMINAPLVCYNGALIIDIYTGHKIMERYIPNELLIKGIGILKRYGYEIGIYHDDILLIDELNDRTKWYVEVNKGIHYKIVGDLGEYIKSDCIDSPKIFGIGQLGDNTEVPPGLMEDLSSDFEVTYAGGAHLEINLKGVNKGSGVKFLADAFKIDRKDVICIGDGHNDVSMLKYAGLGIAMGNADDRIKASADYITVANTENGLLKIVNEFVVPHEKIVL
jgi:Cof subfamily protein (haloacid dehalogenase superfamily)